MADGGIVVPLGTAQFPVQLSNKAKKKYMCVYCQMSKKSRVGRSGLLFFFIFFFIIDKSGNSRSRFGNPIPVK